MIYYASTIFLSAFLLFQIQPMVAKYILPWFGGTPAVWSTTMLFFQALLTGGYAYAYWLMDRLNERKQGIVHLALLSASLTLLLITALTWGAPILPDAAWKPRGVDFPVWDILGILPVAVGLPYLLLATNSPLMQAWFNRSNPSRSPYRLYALSNAGSLLALITYPILIEPALTLKTQATLWSIGFGIFALLAMYGALKQLKLHQPKPEADLRRLAARQTAETRTDIAHPSKKNSRALSHSCRVRVGIASRDHEPDFARGCGHSIFVGPAADDLSHCLHSLL